MDEGTAPFMEDPVGNLHLQAVDSTGDVGIDQFRFINEGFKVGFYRLIDIGQVFLDRTDQILGAQVGSRDDGNSGFQFFIQMLFIAGGSAAQIPDRYKGKTDTQNGHHVHIPNQKSQHSPHSEQNQGQSFYCLIAVRPSGTLQDLFQFVILIKKTLGWCAQKNIQFIRQGGGFSLGAEEGVNKITRFHTKQSQKPSTEQDKTDKIDPLQLTHLLWRLHEFFQFLVGNAIVQQPFLQGIGDQADFFMVPHHTGFTTVISYIVLHFIFV